MNLFNKHVLSSKDLMVNKNHDYGEAWRDMRVSSLTDLILQKVSRYIPYLEQNKLVENDSTIITNLISQLNE